MKTKHTLMSMGALVLALSVSGMPAEAGQRDRQGRDRNGRSSQGAAPGRRDGGGAVERRDGGQPRGGDRSAQERGAPDRGGRATAPDRPNNYGRDQRAERQAPPSGAYRGAPPSGVYRDNRGRAVPRDDRYRYDSRNGYDRYPYNGSGYYGAPRYYGTPRYYGAPRVYGSAPRHYYGPGGNFSVYFGWGNGYMYGSPWSGRVYGYRAPYAYGAQIYYGDLRLLVQPRDAAVYVDGYYAGIVDNFDGVFQRLTLEAGPHTIELDAPGLEPQFFDVYVDPARTTTIRADLFR